MEELLLSLHILVSVLFVGPVAVAVSMFPRQARAALAEGAERATTAAPVRLLHRITQVYALLGISVPVLGFGLAQATGVLGQAWLIVSIVLTALAAGSLLLFVLPAQQAVVDSLDADGTAEDHERAERGLRLLPMTAGVFNLLWVVVVLMMVFKPGASGS